MFRNIRKVSTKKTLDKSRSKILTQKLGEIGRKGRYCHWIIGDMVSRPLISWTSTLLLRKLMIMPRNSTLCTNECFPCSQGTTVSSPSWFKMTALMFINNRAQAKSANLKGTTWCSKKVRSLEINWFRNGKCKRTKSLWKIVLLVLILGRVPDSSHLWSRSLN